MIKIMKKIILGVIDKINAKIKPIKYQNIT